MKSAIKSFVFDPKTLSPSAKAVISDKLYELHCQIFDGVSREAFVRYVMEPETRRTRIKVYEDQNGNWVGYQTCQTFEAEMEGRRNPYVYRTEVGFLPEFRGGNRAYPFMFLQIASQYILSGFRKSWFLATPIQPIPYRVACKNVRDIYPHPHKPTPAPIAQLMGQLSLTLGLEGAGSSPFTKKVGWICRMTAHQHECLKRSLDPAIRFYLKENPSYREGNGMMMMTPVSIANGVYGLRQMLKRSFRKIRRKFRFSQPIFTGLQTANS